MNWIQYHILIELTRFGTRRYSQLRPDDVEGNLFTYHLNGLLRSGLVAKNDRGYILTPKGLEFVGTLSLTTGKTRKQPKILTAIICKNEEGEYLMSRWKREPNMGLLSFPHGMLHYGERLQDMAARELAEKAGLAATSLVYRGEMYVRGMRGNELDRHMLVHLFEARDVQPGRLDERRSEVSDAEWLSFQALKPEDFVPGFYEIAKVAEGQATGMIFGDIDVMVNDHRSRSTPV